MRGIERIGNTFEAARRAGRAAFCPYLPIGFPTYETSLDVIEAAAKAGADLMELGVPFSDPLADGPTIQAATQRALENGTTVVRCLEGVASLRQRGVTTPFMLMGYYNPILTHGIEAFCRHAAEAGADGLIVPDLPPEEGEPLARACRENGLALAYLLAPTSTPARIRLVLCQSSGFVYLVSVIGITGARQQLSPDLADFVKRVRSAADASGKAGRLPIVVGFGISTPEQVAAVGKMADGVIVGSLLVRIVGEAEDPVQAVAAAIRRLLGNRSA